MAEGDILPPEESWYRILTRDEYVASGAHISEAALKAGAISVNSNGARAWSHEVSGRRSSMCGRAKDIDDHGIKFVADINQRRIDRGQKYNPLIKYAGIAYATAGDLQGSTLVVGVTTNVVHTPIALQDDAHTDFVVFGANDTHMDELRTFLQDRLIVSKPGAQHRFATVSSGTTIVISPDS